MKTEFEISETKSGHPTLSWKGKFLHSRYDPKKEALKQVEELKTKITNDKQLIIFIGGGLGYCLELFCKSNKNPVILFEPFVEILKYSFKFTKLKKLVDLGYVNLVGEEFFLEKNKTDTNINNYTVNFTDTFINNFIENFIKNYLAFYNPNEIIFYAHRAVYLIDSIYLKFHQTLEKELNRLSVNQATLSRFEKLWAKNLFGNLKILLNANLIQKLFNQNFTNTALICAAGPSLEKDIETIKKLYNNIIVICVDTALTPLVEFGIQPHIVLSIDPQAISRHYLDITTLEKLDSNCIFIVDPACSNLALKKIKGKFNIFYFWSPFKLFEVFIKHFNIEVSKISFGGSVTTNAYDLAIQMGFKNILFSGMDFSFTQNLAHQRGSVLEKNLLFKINRINTNESHNFFQLHVIPKRKILADFEEKKDYTFTNDKLIIFHQWLNSRLMKDVTDGINFYKLNSYGAKLDRVTKLSEIHITKIIKDNSLIDVKYKINKFLKSSQISLNIKNYKSYINLNNRYISFKNYLNEIKTEFTKLSKYLKHAIKLTEHLILNFENYSFETKINFQNLSFEKWNKKMLYLEKKFQKFPKAMELGGNIIQKNIFETTRISKIVNTKESKSKLELAKRSFNFYNSMLEACTYFQKWINRF